MDIRTAPLPKEWPAGAASLEDVMDMAFGPREPGEERSLSIRLPALLANDTATHAALQAVVYDYIRRNIQKSDTISIVEKADLLQSIDRLAAQPPRLIEMDPDGGNVTVLQ